MDKTNKTSITLELLRDLISEMKTSAGSRLKPKEAETTVIAVEGAPTEGIEEELEEGDNAGLKGHLDAIAKKGTDEGLELSDLLEDEDEDEEPEEEKSPARSRMDRLLSK
jgi:hypothetical protein